MTLSEFIEKIGKNLFEAPLATPSNPDDPPELAEIRHAVMDEVRAKSYRAGAGKVFPYDVIRISMRGVEESRAAVFSSRFFCKYMEQEIQNSLRADGARFPDQLRVEVDVAIGLPQRDGNWLTVEASSQKPVGPPPLARLMVREGKANVAELRLDKPRTNIGREVDVYRSKGLHRRNDLAFVEDSDINRSVSREHAHIQYDRTTGEYRIFNDRWYERGAPVRHLDRPRRHQPRSAPRFPRCEAGARRRDPLRECGGGVPIALSAVCARSTEPRPRSRPSSTCRARGHREPANARTQSYR